MADPTGNPSAKPRSPWLRRLRWSVTIIVGLLVLLYLVLPLIARPIVRSKLQHMVRSHLDADLKFTRLSYVFPYGVKVHDATLTTTQAGQPHELLKLPSISLELAKLPFGEGPLVVRKIRLDQPAVHLIRTTNGMVGRELHQPPSLAVDPAAAPAAAAPVAPAPPPYKLSDMFELRLVEIAGARIIFDDRTKPDTVPLVWRDIDARLTTTPKSNPHYAFDFTAKNSPVATISADGSFDIDALHLTLSQFSAVVSVDPSAPDSPAPGPLQQVFREQAIRGRLSLDVAASVPLKDLGATTLDATLTLVDAQARARDLDDLSLVTRISTTPLTPAQELHATAFHLRTGRPAATTQATTGPAEPSPGLYVLVKDLRAETPSTVATLHAAGLTFDWTAMRWHLDDLRLATQLKPHGPTTRPRTAGLPLEGNLSLTAAGAGDLRSPFDHNVQLKLVAPVLTVYSRRLTLTDVAAEFLMTRDSVKLLGDGAHAGAYEGTVHLGGAVFFESPLRYDLGLRFRSVDLQKFAHDWSQPGETPLKLTGRGSFAGHLRGVLPPKPGRWTDSLAMQGEFAMKDGDFFDLPVLSEIAKSIDKSSEAAHVGQAAGIFTLGNRRLHFKKIAVSSPMLGLQGSGQTTLEGDPLDFRAVVAPLADWKRSLKKTRIPLVSDVLGEVAGGIQQMLNATSGKLLYQFKITGTVQDPKVTTEPAPILTDGALKLFAEMLKGADDLLEKLR